MLEGLIKTEVKALGLGAKIIIQIISVVNAFKLVNNLIPKKI